jgi:hypothetical protein
MVRGDIRLANGNPETACELQAMCQYDPRHNLPQPQRIPPRWGRFLDGGGEGQPKRPTLRRGIGGELGDWPKATVDLVRV